MLFGEVVEGEQGVELVHYLGGGLGEAREGVGERLGRAQGVGTRAGVVDGLDGRFGLWVKASWQCVKTICRLVDPTALLFGGREHVPDGGPEAERPVAHGEHRARQAPVPEAAEQGGPGLLGLAVTVGEGDQFLGAVGTYPDDYQAAQPVLVQPHVEMDAVYPPLDVVDAGEVTARPLLVLGLPRPRPSLRRWGATRAPRCPSWPRRPGSAGPRPPKPWPRWRMRARSAGSREAGRAVGGGPTTGRPPRPRRRAALAEAEGLRPSRRPPSGCGRAPSARSWSTT